MLDINLNNKELPMSTTIARKGSHYHTLYINIWNKLDKLFKDEVSKNI